MKFIRDDKYKGKLFMAALGDNHVVRDAEVVIHNAYSKHPKAYCDKVGSHLQFPRSLRIPGAVFIADIIEVIPKNGRERFYRAMPGSIRRSGSDEVVA